MFAFISRSVPVLALNCYLKANKPSETKIQLPPKCRLNSCPLLGLAWPRLAADLQCQTTRRRRRRSWRWRGRRAERGHRHGGSTLHLAADLASYTTLSRSHTHREEVPALGDQSSTGNRQPKAKEKMASTGDGFVENAPVIKMEESETRPTFEELMKHQRLRSAVLLRVSNKTRSSCKSAEVSSK